jgi:hypothetical protein
MGSVLGILIEDRPSRNFSKPVISSTLANFTEVSEIVLSLFTGLCVLVGKVWWLLVVILSSISGSKISPMSNFSTLGWDKVEEVIGGGGGCCIRCPVVG